LSVISVSSVRRLQTRHGQYHSLTDTRNLDTQERGLITQSYG